MKLSLLAAIALLAASALAFLWARPTAARAELLSARGAAAWFYRACRSVPPDAPARWSVEPGYRLACDLHFANSGQIPFLVKEIKIVNPRPIDLSITALEGPPARRALKPCGYAPRWGLLAERVPAACRSVVKITLALGPNVSENSRLDFVVQVILAEKQP
jgi:hypothetical protein